MAVGTLTYSLTWTARILMVVRMYIGIEVMSSELLSEEIEGDVQIERALEGAHGVSPQDAEVPFRVTNWVLAFIDHLVYLCI